MAKKKPRRAGQNEKGARLQEAIEDVLYQSFAEFGRDMNVSNQTVNNWILRGVPAERAEEAGEKLSVTGAWLRCRTTDRYRPDYEAEGNEILQRLSRLNPHHRDLLVALALELLKVPRR